MWRNIGIGIVVVFLLIQLVPYGRNHTNPAVVQEPQWDSARTRELASRACFDCHSNETEWLWYHNIAPISWGVQFDVHEGREKMNFSEWNREYEESDEAAEKIDEGEMPLPRYLPFHPEAQLTDAEKQELIQGLVQSIGADLPGERGGDDNENGSDNSGSGNGGNQNNNDNSGSGGGDHNEADDD